MKITLSKSQWQEIGKKAGWVGESNDADVERRRVVRVTMDDGDTITTTINGTKKEIEDYYVGKSFEKADETMHKGTKIEFLE